MLQARPPGAGYDILWFEALRSPTRALPNIVVEIAVERQLLVLHIAATDHASMAVENDWLGQQHENCDKHMSLRILH